MELHWLARGVITYDGAVLTMRSTGGSHTFLPGGHVETDIAEDFESAFLRELRELRGLREELAIDVRLSHYLGAASWRWPRPEVTNYEINHIFAVTVAPTLEAWPAGSLIWNVPGYDRTNSQGQISSRFRCAH